MEDEILVGYGMFGVWCLHTNKLAGVSSLTLNLDFLSPSLVPYHHQATPTSSNTRESELAGQARLT
jgi:hypothetical protein